MNRKINLAILGAGNIAGAMAQAAHGISDEVCLYAVASRSIEKAQLFAQKWDIQKAYGSYEELAEDNNIDLVYVATPHSEHYANTKLCIEHGRNCLVEKAFCANTTQTIDLLNLASSKGVYIAEAMWTRYQPVRYEIGDVINRLGNVHYCEADFSVNIRGIERLEKPELCGGALLDLGIYSLTVPVMYWGTDIARIKASCVKNELGVDLHDEYFFTYADGKMAKIKCSFGSEHSNYGKFVGDKGYMVYGPINAPEYYELYDVDGNLIERKELSFIANGYEYEVLEAKKAILEGKQEPESMPHSETIRMMRWMDSLRNHFGIVYPFEQVSDINHSDMEVWGVDNVYDEEDVWDRSNTTSFLTVYDVETKTSEVVATFDKVIEAPNWSSDGKFLVYNSECKVYKFDLESKASTMINSGDLCTINNDHVLSSDDKCISVSDETLDGKSRIYTINIEDGAQELITKQAPSYLHGISPDDKTYCYCACREGEYDIYTIDRGSDEETRLTTASGLNDGPEYDKAGEYIYFNSVRTGLMQAWRMKADGSEQEQLTFDGHLNTWFPHISPDNKFVSMVSYYKGELWPGDHVPNKNVELRLLDMQTGELNTVVKLFGGQGTINVNSWSPDSKKFAYVSYKRNI